MSGISNQTRYLLGWKTTTQEFKSQKKRSQQPSFYAEKLATSKYFQYKVIAKNIYLTLSK